MIDVSTRSVIAQVLDERLRTSYLLDNFGITMPVTHGHDELLPFWYRGDERPSDPTSLKKSRGRPPGGGDAPFTPQEILGTPIGPGTLGCGYLGFETELAGPPSTGQPGRLGGDKDTSLNLKLWIYTPTTRATELREFYTDAFKTIWDAITLTAERFIGQPTGGGTIHWIEQFLPIAPPQHRREVKSYRETLLIIPLLRRQSAN